MPTTGFCWGPMSHIDLATEVLNYSQLLVPQIMELIKNFPYDFLYGNIGADIVIGKNLTDYEYHCHNWLVANQIFKSAKNDHQKAFAYGYISHLAADVIAHNYFVPTMIVSMHRKRIFPHSYWEMRFDKLVENKVIKIIEETFRFRHKDDNELLKNTLEKTILSFSTNKNIFNGIMFVNRKRILRNMLNGLTSDRKWKFSQKQFEMYRLYSIDAIFDVLNTGDKSVYTKFDPTGIEIIDIAMQIRKQLNRLYKHKNVLKEDMNLITQHILPEFPPNLYSNYKSTR
ncbi:MAG: zinc dependent phospholipase C family protein [bacterium]